MPASSHSRADRAVTLVSGVLATALVAFACFFGVFAWNAVRQEQAAAWRNLTDLVARSSNLFFRRYGELLPLVAEDLLAAGGAANPTASREVLIRYQRSQSDLLRINLISPTGALVASSGIPDALASVGQLQDPGFRQGLEAALHHDGMVIGPAIRSALGDAWILPMRLRVLDPRDGSAAFVVSAVIALSEDQVLWQGLRLPGSALVGLIRDDGYALARRPGPPHPEAFYAAPGASFLWRHLQRAGFPPEGQARGVGIVDNVDRFYTFQRLADYPVTAYFSMPYSALWSAWLDRVQVPFALFALLFCGLLSASAWAARQQKARERERDAAEGALRASAAELKRQTALLTTTQRAAHVGGWELDLGTEQLYWTEETYRIHETSPEEFTPTVDRAIDFYTPESQPIVRAGLETAMQTGEPWEAELEMLTARGRRIWVRATGTAERDANGVPVRLSGSLQDVTDRRRADERIRRLAHYDELTGLANRNLFTYHLTHAIVRADRYRKKLAVLFVDVDRFKNINDTLGHDVGDAVLKTIGHRLAECTRGSDLVARLGGDEFVVVVEEYSRVEDVEAIARKILEAVALPVPVMGQEYILTASIGVATFPADGRDVQSLLKHADIAMYRAKDQGKNTYELYTPRFNTTDVGRLSLESRLKKAVLDQNQFVLHYQPKVSVGSGLVTGVEALVRWVGPDGTLVPPSDFIPLAEETGLIGAIGEWVLENAGRQALAWAANGMPSLRIAVNISARQLYSDGFLGDVQRVLTETGIPPSALEFEITESVMMQDVEHVARLLRALKRLGLRIAVDDFGTGYSSLAYLKRLPIDSLKIDRSFVKDVPGDADDATITRAVIALAHSLRLKVVAEGVETAEQLQFLRGLDCDEIQGYLFSRPMPAGDLEALLRRKALLEPHPGARDAA
jgi:diguanylate cyclase (GGDEF)-like protein/PAS domain S-box-containing protein